MRFALEEIELHLRTALSSAFCDRVLLNPKKVKRKKDIASFYEFNEYTLNKINYYKNFNLTLYTETDKGDFMPLRFGRRIKDWVNLIAWRDGILDLTQIPLGLSFYTWRRSFDLEKVIEKNDGLLWILKKSKKHKMSKCPGYYQLFQEISFNKIHSSRSYHHLFSRLPKK